TTPADVDQKIATALLPYTDTSSLNATVALRTTSADVDQKIVGYATTGDLANYATSADLTDRDQLQSAIDAILAQLALLNTGGGNNLINAQAWPGQITWDLLVQNDSFTVSLTCDSRASGRRNRSGPFHTAPFRWMPPSQQHWCRTAPQFRWMPAVAGIDLSVFYTAVQTDATIAAALVTVTLSNAPAGAGNTTWELLKGSNVIRNFHFTGPLVATLVNNTDILQIECQTYSTANQSALDALQPELDGKSTPASVDRSCTTAAMNSAIASADNAVLASVAATYGLKTVTNQLALDVAARQTAADVDQKITDPSCMGPTSLCINPDRES
ncbi:unnamed protein product, partial [Symbiodinium necroappetens]